MSFEENKVLLLDSFIPKNVLCSNNNGKSYNLKIYNNSSFFTLGYNVDSYNQTGLVGKRTFAIMFPRSIRRNIETFEVLGLLQAEMGKKQDGKINFCNHEASIINKVVRWFHKELLFPPNQWKWYIKLNKQEPENIIFKQELEQKVIDYWIAQTGLSFEQAYPKPVSYIKKVYNKKFTNNEYGTLIIERRSNLFSQVVKKMVRNITKKLLAYTAEEIRAFMRGIIAGEGCVEIDRKSKRYRVQISAVNSEERAMYQNALKKINIDCHNYACSNAVMVSKKKHHVELFRQDLLKLSPEKHKRFLEMLRLYQDIPLAL